MSSNNTQGIYSQDSLIIPFGYRYVAKSPNFSASRAQKQCLIDYAEAKPEIMKSEALHNLQITKSPFTSRYPTILLQKSKPNKV
jgi:hypothetical protein